MTPTGPTNPSTGDYNYVLASNVPGWAAFLANPGFNQLVGGAQATLQTAILATFAYAAPGGANPMLNITSGDSFTSLDIIFTSNISGGDQTTLTNLVNRMLDFFIITTDGSTSLGNPANVNTASGLLSSVAITLVCKQGDGTTRTGVTDAVSVIAIPTSIDKTSGAVASGNGTFTFTFGTQTMKGTISAEVVVGLLAPMTLNVTWT